MPREGISAGLDRRRRRHDPHAVPRAEGAHKHSPHSRSGSRLHISAQRGFLNPDFAYYALYASFPVQTYNPLVQTTCSAPSHEHALWSDKNSRASATDSVLVEGSPACLGARDFSVAYHALHPRVCLAGDPVTAPSPSSILAPTPASTSNQK